MIRKRDAMKVETREQMRGGTGTIQLRHAFQETEFTVPCRLCATLTLPPGASIGRHEHRQEEEIYIVLSGSGLLDDGADRKRIEAGDAVLTGNGGAHAVSNDGDTPLELLAVILRG